MSRRSYGSPRVHAELNLGLDARCSSKRVERLIREAGVRASIGAAGAGAPERDPSLEPADDLVKRGFDPVAPDLLWVMDVTQHPTEKASSTWPSSSTP